MPGYVPRRVVLLALRIDGSWQSVISGWWLVVGRWCFPLQTAHANIWWDKEPAPVPRNVPRLYFKQKMEDIKRIISNNYESTIDIGNFNSEKLK